jgi:hypothetical protein
VKRIVLDIAAAWLRGVEIRVPTYTADGRDVAMLEFPGGYIAEVHAPSSTK